MVVLEGLCAEARVANAVATVRVLNIILVYSSCVWSDKSNESEVCLWKDREEDKMKEEREVYGVELSM